MNWAGRAGYKGLSYQSWAAFSFFLQHLRDPNFSYIYVEQPKFQDFNLVFNDGKKIICEAKDWAGSFGLSALKSVLAGLSDKSVSLGDNDQIVIITPKISGGLRRIIKTFRYAKSEYLLDLSKQHDLSDDVLPYISKVSIWNADKRQNIQISYLLFAELLECWVPESALADALKTTLWDNFVERTVEGKTFTRQDFLDAIKKRQSSILLNTGDPNRAVLNELQMLKEALGDPQNPYWTPYKLTTLNLRPHVLAYAIYQFERRSNVNLKDWDFLWKALPISRYSHSLTRIFASNCGTNENQLYALEFLKASFAEGVSFYDSNLFEVNVYDFLQQLLKVNSALKFPILGVVAQIFRKDNPDYFYVSKRNDVRYRKEKLAEVLWHIFDSQDFALRDATITIIYTTFNLVDDEGEHWEYTPPKIFDIIRIYLCESWETFPSKFETLTSNVSSQFNRTYKAVNAKFKFKGWEQWGGIGTGWGGTVVTKDRVLLKRTLIPSLAAFYESNPLRGWDFVLSACITKSGNASSKKPDFLNRAAIPILLQRYRKDGVNSEAFEILKSFMASKRGIPSKRDLILQAVNGGFPENLAWPLVDIVNQLAPLPISPYQEEAVVTLAIKGDPTAMKVALYWIDQPDYLAKPNIFGSKSLDILKLVIHRDFESGFSAFSKIVQSEEFKHQMHWFDAFDWAKLLNTILSVNCDAGLKLLNEISANSNLTENQQILLMNSLIKTESQVPPPAAVTIERIYDEFVLPFLRKYKLNSAEIAKIITLQNPREQFIEFAEQIIRNEHIEDGVSKALRIVEVFISDPSPASIHSPNEEDNLHQTILEGGDISSIETVRGRCAWCLISCCTGKGRFNFVNIIQLIEKLLKDGNYYVRKIACYALSQLTKVRYAFADQKTATPLLADDINQALQLARDIEAKAFEFLDSLKGIEGGAQIILGKALLHVFENLRIIDFERAILFLERLRSLPDEVIGDAAPILVFFAEFRSVVLTENRKPTNRLLQLAISYNFDSKPFQNALIDLCRNGSKSIRVSIAWHIMKLADEDDTSGTLGIQHKEIVLKYLNVILESYDHDTFTSVYMMIWEHIDQDFDACFELWKKCVSVERAALCKLTSDSDLQNARWWPFSFSGDIAIMAFKRGRTQDFLESLNELLEYPEEVYLRLKEDIPEILSGLSHPYDLILKVFKKYVERNPTGYETYVRWLKSNEMLNSKPV